MGHARSGLEVRARRFGLHSERTKSFGRFEKSKIFNFENFGFSPPKNSPLILGYPWAFRAPSEKNRVSSGNGTASGRQGELGGPPMV